jgi:hypothetical protein
MPHYLLTAAAFKIIRVRSRRCQQALTEPNWTEGNEEGTDKRKEAAHYMERQVEPQRNRATEKEDIENHGWKES